jgi:hypothetical protein
MSLVGNLKTVSFSDLLQLVSTNKKTGMLWVTRQSQKKNLFFLQGEIISFVSSGKEDWSLSQFLFRRKRMEKKDWERALLLSKSSGKRIADTLAQLGLVSKAEILEALRMRIEETVFGIFSWEEAEFEFVEGQLPSPGVFNLKINTMGVIMEAAKRVDEWAQVQKTLPPPDFSVQPNLNPPAAKGVINLTLDEYQTLLLIDGQKTINEILLQSSLGEFITSKSLSDLITRGLIVKGEKKTPKEDKKDEEKILLDILFQVYHHCLSVVDETLVQKLGKGKDEILNRLFVTQKEHHPLLDKLIKKGTLEKNNFFSAAEEIPKEIRLHQLLDSLNFLLSQSLITLHSILGENVKGCVSGRIKKEIAPILSTEKWVAEKYQLPEEIYRVLDKV